MSDAIEETVEEKKTYVSRKWLLTVWSAILATLVVVVCGIATFTKFALPDGFIGLGLMFGGELITYIGGNVAQKFAENKSTGGAVK